MDAPFIGRCTYARYGACALVSALRAAKPSAPALAISPQPSPTYIGGADAILASWANFRYDDIVRDPPPELKAKLDALGCYYDEQVRGWSAPAEEIEILEDGTVTRGWDLNSRGLRVAPACVTSTIFEVETLATAPEYIDIAAAKHFDRLRRKVREANDAIDADYRERVRAAVAAGETTWHETSSDSFIEFLPNSRQRRRHHGRLRRRGNSRGLPQSEAMVALAQSAAASDVDELEKPIIEDNVKPIAFMAETRRIPAWSEFTAKVRVAKAATVGKTVGIFPLEDADAQHLDVMIAPSISEVDENGYTTIKGINPNSRPVSLAVLTQVARFVIDPRVSTLSLEFTTDEILSRIHLPSNLTASEMEYLRAMIHQRRRLFATTLGWAHGYKQKIETPLIDSGEALPPAFPMRHRSPGEWAVLKEFVDKQLKQRLIEPCVSPYNAVPMAIKKPDGSQRVVVDLRAVNALCKRDVYPLPNVQANLNKLGRAKYFTAIDLLMGFHQCELDEDSKLKTAFGTPWGQMCYTRMPMGLTSSPGAFMRLVDASLKGLDPSIITPYMDDILISTPGTFEEHVDAVGKVFEKLIASGFTVRCDKVHLCMTEGVGYLGFLVGAYGTRPDPKKTKPILDMALEPLMTDPAAPARFAGMVAFYQRFIPNCSYMLAPFYDLRQKNADHNAVVSSLRFQAAFHALKHALINVTALNRPDYSKPFYIDVDAATVGGVGAVLSQRDNEDDASSHRPLAFYSRRFNPTERGYPVRDQECMGLVESIVEWRPYVLGAATIVRTDHKSLKWLMTCQHADGSRVAGWALKIQEFGVEIQYIPGKDHVVPDCISRAVASAAGYAFDGEHTNVSNQPTDSDVPGGPVTIHVSTSAGPRSPAKLLTLGVCDLDSKAPIKGVEIGMNICDTGSGAEIMGTKQYELLRRLAPGCIRKRATPLPTSLDRITGVGNGFTRVRCHCELMLDLGGAAIYYEDMAVLDGHDGILIGNETLNRGRAVIKYEGDCGGHVRLCNTAGEWISRPVPFTVARQSSAACFAISSTPSTVTAIDPISALVSAAVPSTALPATDFTSPGAVPAIVKLGIVIIDASLNILTERQGDATTLPAINIKPGTHMRRRDIAAFISAQFSDHSHILPHIASALTSGRCYPSTTGQADTRYFIVVLPHGVPLPTLHSHAPTFSTSAAPIDEAVNIITDDGDTTFLEWLFSVARNRRTLSSTHLWLTAHARNPVRRLRDHVGAQNRGRKAQHKISQPSSAHCAAISSAIENGLVDATVPRLSSKPNGPALCKSTSEIQEAARRLHRRLASKGGRVLAVDLEGELGGPRSHVAKIQVAVDGDEDESEPLVYVIDSHKNPGAVKATGPDSLRALFESPDIVKVIHHCRGDTGALFYQFGIITNNVFDTAIADCLLNNLHHNNSRSLEAVLLHWLGAHVVHLQFKGKLVHAPRMFEEDPLPYYLFVYAYEDVLYLGALYRVLAEHLTNRNLERAHISLTAARAPPRALPPRHPRFQPPTHIAIALADNHHIVCVKDNSTGTLRLPTATIAGSYVDSTHAILKKQASGAWESELGKPPKGVAASINAKLRSPLLLTNEEGDILLYQTSIDDCVARIGALKDSLLLKHPEGRVEVVLFGRDSLDKAKGLCLDSQLAAFQFLGSGADGEPRPVRSVTFELPVHSKDPDTKSGQALAVSAWTDERTEGNPPEHEPAIRLRAALTISGGRVQLRLASTVIPVPAPHTATVSVVTGKTITEKRAAIILHDSTSRALAVTIGTSSSRAWPAASVLVGEEPESAAIRAFDTYAGPSVRKGCSGAAPAVGALSPIFGKAINDAFENRLHKIGEFGNTTYFAAKFEGIITSPATTSLHLRSVSGDVKADIRVNPCQRFETLYHCASVFAASRRACNGFKLLPSLAAKHPHADIINVQDSGGSLGPFDKKAAAALLELLEPGNNSDVAAVCVAPTEPKPWRDPTLEEGSAAPLPSLGEDPAFDKLFCAYVTVLMGSAVNEGTTAGLRTTATAFPVSAEPDVTVSWKPESIGGKGAQESCAHGQHEGERELRSVSKDDIRKEQQTHPATSGLIHFLLTSDVDDNHGQTREQLEKLGATHFLDSDGVLCYNSGSPRSPDRIVLPPRFHFWCCRQFHSRQGHPGVGKTVKAISKRYIWGTADSMREDIQFFIRHCQLCARLKLGRHRPGEGHLVDQGRGPFDIVDTDVFKSGVTAETGEDTIISFADHFTRMVLVHARKGDPTSEEFADTLVRTLIGYYGVPRIIRSDHASVLVSSGIKKLYKIFNITSEAGNPYIHRSIGLVERWHSTLKHLLLTLKATGTVANWPRFLPLLQLSFNTAIAHATGYSPFFLNHLRQPRLPVDNISIVRDHIAISDMPTWVARSLAELQVAFDAASQRLVTQQLNAKRIWDLKHDVVTKYKVGDGVLVVKGTVMDGTHAKNSEPTHGPFTILACLPHDNYRLGDLHNQRLHDEFHVSRLRPYPSQSRFSEAQEALLYPVHAIVGHRIRTIPADQKGVLAFAAGEQLVEYRIRWRGFTRAYDSFRSVHFLDNIFELVAAYRAMRQAQGLTPLPDDLPPLPVVERNRVATPPPSPEAADRRLRFQAAQQPDATPPPPTSGAPLVADDATAPATPDLYPPGTLVQVRHPDGWHAGEVVKSFLSKRTKERPRERRIIISYSSESTLGLCEHSLANIPIRLAPPPPPSAAPPPPTASEPTTSTADASASVQPQQPGVPLQARFVKGQGWLYQCAVDHRGRSILKWLPTIAFRAEDHDLLVSLQEQASATNGP